MPPVHRYAAASAAASEQDHHEPQAADERYGLIKSVEQENTRYPDDPYAHQRGYEEEPEPRTRSAGMVTVAAALALAVVGTGAALAYRTYVRLSAQRRAADHHSRQQRDQGGADPV